MKNSTFAKLSKLLKSSRQKANLSQIEVANHLGYSTSQFISNWERGLSSPPLEVVKKLAKFYGISSDDLFDIIHKATMEQVDQNLKRKIMAAKQQ